MMNKKGQTSLAPIIVGIIMSIVIAGIVVYTIFFPTMTSIASTSPASVVNESIDFAVNNTYYSFANQANCLSASTHPTNCGVMSVSYVGNASMTLTSPNYTFTTTQTKLMRNPAWVGVGVYNVSYTYYDLNTLPTSQISNFNTSVLLGGVIVIIVALIGFMMLVRLVA